jgi:hypothetical protein
LQDLYSQEVCVPHGQCTHSSTSSPQCTYSITIYGL